MSLPTAVEIGAVDGGPVTVSTTRGALTLPLVVTPMADRVVWVPANSPHSTVRATLGADSGALVTITADTAGTGPVPALSSEGGLS
jgi:NADH-quinone oxidoreductase subunit G